MATIIEITKDFPLRTEIHRLSNGDTFGLPADAIDPIKKIIISVLEVQLIPDAQKPPEWSKCGHTIGNSTASLQSVALFGAPAEEQRILLETTMRDLINKKGEDIRPLLLQLGFPDVK